MNRKEKDLPKLMDPTRILVHFPDGDYATFTFNGAFIKREHKGKIVTIRAIQDRDLDDLTTGGFNRWYNARHRHVMNCMSALEYALELLNEEYEESCNHV